MVRKNIIGDKAGAARDPTRGTQAGDVWEKKKNWETNQGEAVEGRPQEPKLGDTDREFGNNCKGSSQNQTRPEAGESKCRMRRETQTKEGKQGDTKQESSRRPGQRHPSWGGARPFKYFVWRMKRKQPETRKTKTPTMLKDVTVAAHHLLTTPRLQTKCLAVQLASFPGSRPPIFQNFRVPATKFQRPGFQGSNVPGSQARKTTTSTETRKNRET